MKSIISPQVKTTYYYFDNCEKIPNLSKRIVHLTKKHHHLNVIHLLVLFIAFFITYYQSGC